jgi:hypothetical protein
VDDPEQLASAWLRALSAERPVIIEVKTDPEVAPLPLHITLEQGKSFMLSLKKVTAAQRRPSKARPVSYLGKRKTGIADLALHSATKACEYQGMGLPTLLFLKYGCKKRLALCFNISSGLP